MSICCTGATRHLSAVGLLVLVGLATIAAPREAAATTLTGDSIQVYRLYPDKTTIYDTIGPVTDPGTTGESGFHILLSDHQVTFTTVFGSTSFGPATFNGFEILDLTKDPHITGVSLNSASTSDPATVSDFSFTSNSVFFNFANQTVTGTTIYDLTFATTPLPGALTLLVTALGGLGFWGWRRNLAQTV
jgi:hypothetical protein